MSLAIDAALVKYADFAVGLDLMLLREDAIAHLDGKKTLRKISGKRPGKKCGNSYVSADKQCKGHSSKTESGKRKLTAAGKKSAEELAAKVRARKGLKALGKKEMPQPPKMPKLKGSEKQVDWANRIREVTLKKIDEFVAEKAEKAGAKKESFAKALEVVMKEVAAERPEAKWWIDNRVSGGRYGEKQYNMVDPFTIFQVSGATKKDRWADLVKTFKLDQ